MLTIDVISGVICPWCFIGERRLEEALDARPATVRRHPFRLNPDMPREGVERKSYRIRKFGSWERSQELEAQVAAAGQGEGIAFDLDRQSRTPNTLDAHRVIWLAGERGVQDAVVEALFVAYFTGGRDPSDRATLAEIAAGGRARPGRSGRAARGRHRARGGPGRGGTGPPPRRVGRAVLRGEW